MSIFNTVLGVLGAVGTIGSTVASFKQAKAMDSAANAQAEANALARRQASLLAAQKRRALARERMLKAAQNAAQAQAAGLGGSSVASGIQGALNSNFANALSYLNQSSAISTMRASFLDQAYTAQAQASVLGTYSNVLGAVGGKSLSIFSTTPEFQKLVTGSK